ncbi:MAG: CHRD domain-containing protein [Burkholderiaceae bacterium]|nr:CHRD domain-containing protein [Burkholderiaceae bacterium]
MTIRRFISITLGCAVVVALAGCASVDLEPDYNAPQVRMPGEASAAPVAEPPAPVSVPVQTLPVAPNSAVVQSLPPANNGATAPNVAATPNAAANADIPPSAPVNADANLVTLTTRLDGTSAVPPTGSSGSAQIDALYDANTRLLRWKATWNNLSSPITAVRFHGPAAQGQQGPETLIWPGPFGAWYEGRATLTPQQATDLTGGLWYANIYTTNYPSGEIRGQLRVVN